MTKIDIFSGFLGAGKTTLIKKLIKEAYAGEKVVLIENEFGEIGIDGGFLADAGIEITEMNSGCICCSLVGDFSKALVKVLEEYNPDRIIIEPSGVGKLSDVIRAAKTAEEHGATLNCFTTVADVNKCKMYMKNFGEFYNDQIANASSIVLSHTQTARDEKIAECMALLRQHNADAVIVTTPWDLLDGKDILLAMEHKDTIEDAVKALEEEHHHHHHHHHHEEHCECGCHGHHDHEHHHHDHEEGCSCGHDHGHHHADEVFTSWGVETAHKFTVGTIRAALASLDTGRFGTVLRAKGIVACVDGGWIHFDYVPGEENVRMGSAAVIGKLCVIGAQMDEAGIAALFGL